MKVIDELRDMASVYTYDGTYVIEQRRIDKIADEIERELFERYMKLPVDVDGVPIHVGDVMIDLETPREVVAVTEEHVMLGGYPMTGEQQYRFSYARNHRHRKPTVEDVLREFAYKVCDLNVSDEAIGKYADKLREVMGGDVE